MEAGKSTISDIFNGNRVLEIPFFQRAYVWGEDQWERLLEDLKIVSKTSRPYFLGSVILKQQLTESSSKSGDIRTVIDGQQRLTTLNILLKVLCLKNDKNNLFERRFKLEDDELALWHNKHDIETFTKVLNAKDLNETFNINKEDNILKAYNYFKTNVDASLLDWNKILNNIMFVSIDLAPDEDEQQIFDTINSLGVRLTTAELLKNYFFNRNDFKDYQTYWESIFEKDKATRDYWDREITAGSLKRTFIDLFFYAYLQIKVQEQDLKVKADDKIEFSKLESLFESYKRFIKDYKIDKMSILAEIREYANLFKDNFDYDVINNELTSESGMDRINAIIFGLDTSTLIPYTLYILKKIDDKEKLTQLFAFIESFIMRRMVFSDKNNNYKQVFERLISNSVLTKEQFISYLENSRASESNVLPNDEQLKHGFNNSEIINKQAAGIIYFIESKIRNKEKQATKLLGLNKYSLEHLMPKKWANEWDRLPSREAETNRNFKLKTLGNLAIITQSLNASIRDSKWQTKKEKGLMPYSSGIETLAPFLALDEWNETQIEKRAEFLYTHAKEIWKI